MWQPSIPVLSLVVRSLAIYLALLLGLRLFGKREVGQFTLFDLVLVLLVANAVQPAITGPDSSLTGGLVIMASLFAANAAIARLRPRVPFLRRLTEGQPAVIARNGAWDWEALRREGLDLEDCLMALREHGFAQVSEVGLAVLEPDGTISVVPRQASIQRTRRHVRTRRI